MTNIEQKAQQLLNEVRAEYPLVASEVVSNMALCRAIERHEAFRQEVSDAVEKTANAVYSDSSLIVRSQMKRFIIAKPDPLVEVLDSITQWSVGDQSENAKQIRAVLAKRGGRIVFDD